MVFTTKSALFTMAIMAVSTVVAVPVRFSERDIDPETSIIVARGGPAKGVLQTAPIDIGMKFYDAVQQAQAKKEADIHYAAGRVVQGRIQQAIKAKAPQPHPAPHPVAAFKQGEQIRHESKVSADKAQSIVHQAKWAHAVAAIRADAATHHRREIEIYDLD